MNTRNFFVGMSKLHDIAQDPTDKQKIEAIAGIAAGAMFEGVQPTTPAARFMNYLGMCESQAKTPQDVAAINLVRGRVMIESAAEKAGKGGEVRADVNEVIKKPVDQIVAILNANKDNAKLIINTAFKNYQAGVKQAAADAKKAEKEQKVTTQNEAGQKTIDANKARTDKVKDIKGQPAAENNAEIAKNIDGIKDRAQSLAANARQALRKNKGIGGKLAGAFRGAKQTLLGEGIDQATVAKLSGPEAIALCEAAGIKVPALI